MRQQRLRRDALAGAKIDQLLFLAGQGGATRIRKIPKYPITKKGALGPIIALKNSQICKIISIMCSALAFLNFNIDHDFHEDNVHEQKDANHNRRRYEYWR